MSVVVRISDDRAAAARKASQESHRSQSQQADYWMALGEAVERLGLLTATEIGALITQAKIDTDQIRKNMDMRAVMNRLSSKDDEWDAFMENLKAEDEKRGMVAKS
ncbi:MAG: hypothetical protein CL539_18650 [Alcanivorax sp.]|uniref:TA system antitoxin ParD family protein n=1 Tax=Alcanivorax sp. TaxID=1872427 RepID=UPI000C934465|nr:hypothetical protein [Alcanivorax sp.]MAC16669.1 hypothetical protein [Alcanivorax sp.]|tara:strand:+ start:14254 stop:14571 length:318 start_codon:yes stop_codon:yes gene_type:complete